MLLCGACAPPRTAVVDDDVLIERHVQPVVESTTAIVEAGRMRRRFDDLHALERLLVGGKLDEATTLAYLLDDPDLGGVDAAARAVANAPSLDQALRREPMIAAGCATCHERTHAHVGFTFRGAPRNRPTLDAQRARHRWAVDRLFEAMVGPDDDRWRAGLEILATTPLEMRPTEAMQLQGLARAALAAPSSGDRTTSYGDLLTTCAACHARRSR